MEAGRAGNLVPKLAEPCLGEGGTVPDGVTGPDKNNSRNPPDSR